SCSPRLSLLHTASTALYTLSLHDALPISARAHEQLARLPVVPVRFCSRKCFPRDFLQQPFANPHTGKSKFAQIQVPPQRKKRDRDRKSTRLNSSHRTISYAVFCLKKKKKK